jgi:hypothetical protein
MEISWVFMSIAERLERIGLEKGRMEGLEARSA